MLKFFFSGLLASSAITVIAPQASLIIGIVAGLALVAIGIEWHGGKRGRQRKARKALPKIKA